MDSLPPSDDKIFAQYVTQPELAALLPVLYPGVFPNLAALVKSGKPRADLEAILLTGIPKGIIPGFTNFTGPVLADMLRLNTSIPPTPAGKQSIYGLLGGDPGGFPNGRRVTDDIVAIELEAIAGVTYPLIDKSFTPDAAAGELTDGLTPADTGTPTLGQFPYLGIPATATTTRTRPRPPDRTSRYVPARASGYLAGTWVVASIPLQQGADMTEPAAGPSGPGTVVLDLGAGTGALILYTPADLDGAEIEISRDDDTVPGAPIPRSASATPPPRSPTRLFTRAWPRGGTPSGATSPLQRLPPPSPAARSPAATGQT